MSGSGEEEVGGGCEPDILWGGRYQKFEGWISGHSDILGNVYPQRKLKVGFQVSATLGDVPPPVETFFSHF